MTNLHVILRERLAAYVPKAKGDQRISVLGRLEKSSLT
jgi:hypothetical protein